MGKMGKDSVLVIAHRKTMFNYYYNVDLMADQQWIPVPESTS